MRRRAVVVGLILAASAAGFFVLRGGGDKGEEHGGLPLESLSLLGNIAGGGGAELGMGSAEIASENAADADGLGANRTGTVSSGYQFRHPRLGFTLELPDGFSVGKFEEEENGMTGEITLVRGSDDVQLQIYATAFDEEGPITPERIRKDLPNLIISAPQQVVLHGGMPALVFLSENAAFGKTQEVWFVHDGFLYQLTTTAPMKKETAKIIGLLTF